VAETHSESRPGEALTGYTFTIKGGSTWTLPVALMERLTKANPGKDIPAEIEAAALWSEANPAKRKTAAGMPRFLTGWLNRADPVNIAASIPFPPLPPEDDEGDGIHMPARLLLRRVAP